MQPYGKVKSAGQQIVFKSFDQEQLIELIGFKVPRVTSVVVPT